jgi:hypothetical protein
MKRQIRPGIQWVARVSIPAPWDQNEQATYFVALRCVVLCCVVELLRIVLLLDGVVRLIRCGTWDFLWDARRTKRSW